MIPSRMMALGMGPDLARATVGGGDAGVSATGSTSQANSYAITSSNTYVSTTAANTGVRLPVGEDNELWSVFNGGASTLLVYPPVGGKINGGTTDASISVTTLKNTILRCIQGTSGLQWTATTGA